MLSVTVTAVVSPMLASATTRMEAPVVSNPVVTAGVEELVQTLAVEPTCEIGEAEMVYTLLSTPELTRPDLVVIALMVVVLATEIGVLYVLPVEQVPGEVAAGVVPLVV